MYDIRKPPAEWTDEEVREYYAAALEEAEYIAGYPVATLEDLVADIEN